jgi:ubiquinol-cytochrome c reductase cytochrome b subunit
MMHEPDGDDRFGRTALKGEMPSMDVKPKDADADWKALPREDMQAAAAFLASQADPAAAKANVERGKQIVKTRCTACHLFEGNGDDGGQGLAPELSGYGSRAWVRAQIANPSSKATYRENALDPARKRHMPRFDGDLSPADIDLLAGWVAETARSAGR